MFAVGFQLAEEPPFFVQKVTSVTDGKGNLINGTIQPGDIILEVERAPPRSAQQIIFGEKESVVKLSILSASGYDFECTVKRNVPIGMWQRWHPGGKVASMRASADADLDFRGRCKTAGIHSTLQSATEDWIVGRLSDKEKAFPSSKLSPSCGVPNSNSASKGGARGRNGLEAEKLKEGMTISQPAVAAIAMLRAENGVPVDLLRDDEEYLLSTLGLKIDDTIIQYVIPAGPAYLEGSLKIGDRIVAIDSTPVDAQSIVTVLQANERIGTFCTLMVERPFFREPPAQQWPPPLDCAVRADLTDSGNVLLDVRVPRSSRPFVSRAEHMFGLLDQHKELLCGLKGNTCELYALHNSLRGMLMHALECERKRIAWEQLVAAQLARVQSACITALEEPLCLHRTAQVLAESATIQRHRACHLEQRIQETVGELAKLAELTAHSEEPRKKTPMLHTLLERREFLLAEMQEKLRAAREEVGKKEREIEALRSALQKCSEFVFSAGDTAPPELALLLTAGGGATEFSSKPNPNPQNEGAAKQALELELELKAMQSALDALNEAKDLAMRERDSERERASEREREREKLCIENTALKESLQKKIDECSTLSAYKRKVHLELHAADDQVRQLQQQLTEEVNNGKALREQLQKMPSCTRFLQSSDTEKNGPELAAQPQNAPQVLSDDLARSPARTDAFDFIRALELTRLAQQLVAEELLSDPNLMLPAARESGQATTLGFLYDDTTRIISKVLDWGPASNSKRVCKGDFIVSIDGKVLRKGNIDGMLVGTDKPDSVVTLGLKRSQIGEVVEVKLRRMLIRRLADSTRIFELLTKLSDCAKEEKDEETERCVQEVIELLTAAMREEADHDAVIRRNVDEMQEHCASLFQELLQILEDGLADCNLGGGEGGEGGNVGNRGSGQDKAEVKEATQLQAALEKQQVELSKMSKGMQEATKKLQEECSELTAALDKKNEEFKHHEVEIERLKNDLAERENDLLLALAEALKDRDDLRKKLAETEKDAVKAKALPPTPSAPPDAVKARALPPTPSAPETEKDTVKAKALPPTPSSPPGPIQRDVDQLKQALAEALKDQEDLKKKLAETEVVTKTKVQAQKSATPPPSFSGPDADDVKTSKENAKSQKLLSMPALPPPAQLTMILDLDFASTGAEGSGDRERFKQDLSADLAAATDLPSPRFDIKSLSPGSVIVDVEIMPDTAGGGLEPAVIARDLVKQAAEASSKLRTGKLTCAVKHVAVFGTVRSSPPPRQQAVVDKDALDEVQKEVDDLKQTLAEALKDKEDLKKKLAGIAEKEMAVPATTSAPATPATPPGGTQKEFDDLKQARKKFADIAEKERAGPTSDAPSMSGVGLLLEIQKKQDGTLVHHVGGVAADGAAAGSGCIAVNAAELQNPSEADISRADTAHATQEVRQLQQQLTEEANNAKVLRDQLQKIEATLADTEKNRQELAAQLKKASGDITAVYGDLVLAASALWERKQVVCGLCMLLMAISSPQEHAERLAQLRSVQESHEFAGSASAGANTTRFIEPMTNLLRAIHALHDNELRDATLVLEAFLFDSTPLTHQVMTKLCSSLITVPPRVKLMKRHTEMSEIFEKSLLPQATDARSFGHEVIAKLPSPDYSYPPSVRNSIIDANGNGGISQIEGIDAGGGRSRSAGALRPDSALADIPQVPAAAADVARQAAHISKGEEALAVDGPGLQVPRSPSSSRASSKAAGTASSATSTQLTETSESLSLRDSFDAALVKFRGGSPGGIGRHSLDAQSSQSPPNFTRASKVMSDSRTWHIISPSTPPPLTTSPVFTRSPTALSQNLSACGVGLLLHFDRKGSTFVREVLRDGPADVEGTIRGGDQLLEIDGMPLQGKLPAQIVDLMVGPHGSWMHLGLYRRRDRLPLPPSSGHGASPVSGHRASPIPNFVGGIKWEGSHSPESTGSSALASADSPKEELSKSFSPTGNLKANLSVTLMRLFADSSFVEPCSIPRSLDLI